jgi:PEP-CTERM motif-containing protein
MRRMLFVATLAIAWASASSAVTLAVVPDKPWYYNGETITLSIMGDAQGATTYGIFGRLKFNGLALDNGTRTQKTIGPTFTKGTLDAGDTNVNGADTAYAEAFDQVALFATYQTATNPISTVTLIAGSLYFGVVNVAWDITTPGFALDFFGLTNAPGTTFTVIPCDGCPVIPEPGTGGLFALGLLLLTARRRT